MCVQKERLHPTQHSHRVTKTTVTSQRNTWTGDARLELHNPLELRLGPSHSCAGPMHTDAFVHTTLSLRPIAFLKYTLSPFLLTPYHTLHSTHYTLHRTMHSHSSRQSAIHQDVHTSQSKVQGRAPSTRMFIPNRQKGALDLRKRRQEIGFV